MYALMLPSGNDAACLLAESFGLLMYYENIKP
jgi:D-alanyl-D-alanine carboxypeptidase